MMILLRSQARSGYMAVLHVVSLDCPDTIFQDKSRRYTGIMKLPTVPPGTVRSHLAVELEKRIPRACMGKSNFAYERIIRYLFCAGLGLTSTPYIELDMRIVDPPSLKQYMADASATNPRLMPLPPTPMEITKSQKSQSFSF